MLDWLLLWNFKYFFCCNHSRSSLVTAFIFSLLYSEIVTFVLIISFYFYFNYNACDSLMDRADKGCDENVTTLDFCLEGAVCRKWCSQKACNIHNIVILCWSLFLNVLAWRPATLLKQTLTQVFSCEYCEAFK